MKTHLKHLLGLALMVFVLAGCSNPAEPEIPEGAKVEFRWGENPDIGQLQGKFETHSPSYLLNLHFNEDLKLYAYNFDRDCDKSYEDALKEVFGTKYYKEGTTIDLKKWTSRAVDLDVLNSKLKCTERLYFSIESKAGEGVKFFDEIIVGNEDILVYVFFGSQKFDDINELPKIQ